MGNWIANKLIEHDASREIHVFKKFKEGAKQVTYGTFSRTLGTDLLDMVRNKMNYVKDKRSGLTISADEEVKIYSDKNKYFVKVENEYKALGKYGYLKDYLKNRRIEE